MLDNSRNSVMFVLPTLLIDSFLTDAGIVVSGLIQAELFSIHSQFPESFECEVGALRKLRFLYCSTVQNTFIQCQPRMNRALMDTCTVPPKTSCRASYANNSWPISWPVILKPGKSASRKTTVADIRHGQSMPANGRSLSGHTRSRTSGATCRRLSTPVWASTPSKYSRTMYPDRDNAGQISILEMTPAEAEIIHIALMRLLNDLPDNEQPTFRRLLMQLEKLISK